MMFRCLTLSAAVIITACAAPPPPPPPPEAPSSLIITAPDGVGLGATRWPGETGGPGVVLLGVAGPNDRWMSFGELSPFAALAEALSDAGVHVLAYDDRGVGESGGDWTAVNFEAMARDAQAAAERLAAMPGVDPDRIGFFGLSEGSGVALHAAARGHGAFLILGSPPGLAGEAALRARLVAALDAQGEGDAVKAQYLAAFDRFAQMSRAGDLEALSAFLSGPGAALVPRYAFVPREPEQPAALFASPSHVAQLAFDPAPLLAAINQPVLVLGGRLDPVLDPAVNHPPLLAGLANAKGVVIEDANHLLIPAQTGSPAEYPTLSEDLHPDVVEAVLDWMEAEGLLRR